MEARSISRRMKEGGGGAEGEKERGGGGGEVLMDGHLMERENSASFIQKIQSSPGTAVGYLLTSASRRLEFICRFRRCVFSHEAEIRPTLHLREKRRPREYWREHAGEERDNDAS